MRLAATLAIIVALATVVCTTNCYPEADGTEHCVTVCN